MICVIFCSLVFNIGFKSLRPNTADSGPLSSCHRVNHVVLYTKLNKKKTICSLKFKHFNGAPNPPSVYISFAVLPIPTYLPYYSDSLACIRVFITSAGVVAAAAGMAASNPTSKQYQSDTSEPDEK